MAGTQLSPSQIQWLSTIGTIISIGELEDKLFQKLALNACINPVGALFRCTNGQILRGRNHHDKEADAPKDIQDFEPWDWVQRLARETRAVYGRARPHLDMAELEGQVAALASQTSDNTNSMLADIQRLMMRRSHSANNMRHQSLCADTELNFINGAIVQLANQYNVPTPWHEEMIRQINKTITCLYLL